MPDPRVASTDVAFLGGAGVLLPMGTSSLSLDARYSVGFTRIEQSSELKNRGFTFAAAVMLPIGR